MGTKDSPGWLRISVRRAGSQRGLLAALAALTAAASLLLTGMVGLSSLSANAHAIDSLEAATASERTLVIQSRLADDAATQQLAATELLDHALGTSSAEQPLLIEFSEQQQGSASYVRWTITPNPDGLTAASLPRLIEGLEGLQRSFLDDRRVNVLGVTAEGNLAATLATIHRRIAAEQTGSLVPVLLIAVVTGVAIVQTARLLGGARQPEFALLRSRGASARRLWISAAVEAAAVATPAAIGGGAAAVAVLGRMFDRAPAAALWGYALTVAIASIVAATAAARGSIGTATVRDSAFLGRGRTAVGLGATALVVLLAATSLWQFSLAGSPLVTAGGGQGVVDPFLAAAPALVLLAAVALGLLLVSPVARSLDSWTAGFVGVLPSLPVRQVARRPASHLVTVAMAAVAAGAIVIAAGYAGTIDRISGTPGELAVGADVRVDGVEAGALDAGQLDAVGGVTASAPVFVASAQYGDEAVELVALPASLVASVMTDAGGALDLAGTQQAIGASQTAVPAVISSAFAERFDLGTGDALAIRSVLLGNAFDLVVAGTIAAVPGTTGSLGIIADLAAVTAALPDAPDASAVPLSTWIASTDPAATAEEVRALFPDAEVSVAAEATTGAPAATTVALWLAAAGSIALAGAGMLASTGISGRTRAVETTVLRALGMSRRQLSAGAAVEFTGVVVLAILLGAAAGLAVCMLTVGNLARSATVGLPRALEVVVAFDFIGLAVGAGALLAVTGLVALSIDRGSRPAGGGR